MSKIRVAIIGSKEYYDRSKGRFELMGWDTFHVDSKTTYNELKGMEFDMIMLDESSYVED